MAEKTSDAIKSVVEGVKSVAIGKDNPQKQVKKEKKDKKKQPTEGGDESRPLEVGSQYPNIVLLQFSKTNGCLE